VRDLIGLRITRKDKERTMIEMPILRLELDRMKQTMHAAIVDYNEEISKATNAALEEILSEENFRYLLKKQLREVLNKAVEREIEFHFGWNGKGREVIEAAVQEAFKQPIIQSAKEVKDLEF
jgi:hypothetical protein